MSDRSPLISIITVVLNGANTLETTIKSVLNNSYDRFEYIIIDGGSTDSTLKIIERYQYRIDCWVSEKDYGIYDAMNKGIKIARGEIIGILNSGDLYTPDTLKTVAKLYNPTQKQIITGSIIRYDYQKKIQFQLTKTPQDLKQNIHWGMPINHPATFVTRTAYSTVGLFNSSYSICADYDLIYRAYYNSQIQFTFTNDVLAYMSSGGISERFINLFTRCREHFKIESDRISFFTNYSLRIRWLIINLTKYSTKKLLSNAILSRYYTLRHDR